MIKTTKKIKIIVLCFAESPRSDTTRSTMLPTLHESAVADEAGDVNNDSAARAELQLIISGPRGEDPEPRASEEGGDDGFVTAEGEQDVVWSMSPFAPFDHASYTTVEGAHKTQTTTSTADANDENTGN